MSLPSAVDNWAKCQMSVHCFGHYADDYWAIIAVGLVDLPVSDVGGVNGAHLATLPQGEVDAFHRLVLPMGAAGRNLSAAPAFDSQP